MSIGLNNNFEAKVRNDKDSTSNELKKVVLLNNFNISTAHNFAADSLRWTPIRMGSGFSLLKDKMTINFGATFDPYALNENNIRINTYNILNGGGLLRLTSANINMNYSITSNELKGKENEEDNEEKSQSYNMIESTSSGGRDDDLFGKSEDFSDRRMNAENDKPVPKYPSYRTEIPWDLTFAYSLTYNNNRRQRDFTNNSLMFSGNIELTPKWEVGLSSGYDFKGKGFTYTQLRFNRDLNSWRLNFSWVPFSDRSSWNFFIGIKSGLLSDIKYEKQSLPNRTY
jgi:hypothetical protein